MLLSNFIIIIHLILILLPEISTCQLSISGPINDSGNDCLFWKANVEIETVSNDEILYTGHDHDGVYNVWEESDSWYHCCHETDSECSVERFCES